MAAITEKKTHQAGTQPRISHVDDVQGPFCGFRGFATAAAATATATISNVAIAKDTSSALALTDGVTLALTDLVVYAQAAGALVQIKSGADVIWASNVGAGSAILQFMTPIMCNKGEDLVVVISVAGTACSVAMAGRVMV